MTNNSPSQLFLRLRVDPPVTPVGAWEYDAQLMLRVREGDETSFALLLERHRNAVVHFIYRMVQNQAVAEELAQEVFLRVYRARATYEPSARFTTWLFRIAAHRTLNWLRDHRGQRAEDALPEAIEKGAARHLADRGATIEQKLVRQSDLNEIRRAIQMLPEKQRAAVIMHKYHELDYRQIAQSLSCSESAVKSLLFRAYETLRARLAHCSVG